MNVTAVRQGLANAITAGVTSSVGLLATWYVPDGVTVPCAFVKPDTIDFDKTMARGTDEMTFIITVYVSRADDIASQEWLDRYLAGSGPGSFKAAIEAARGAPGQFALNGACHDLHVVKATAYQWYLHGETRYLGGQLTVRVIGSGSS